MATADQHAWVKAALGFDAAQAAEAARTQAAGSRAAPGPGANARVGNKPVDPALQTPQPGKKPNQALFLTEPGDPGDVRDTDINQGSIGDCFLLSSIGEIARIKPDMIKHMIKDNKDGTYTVTLYQRESGFWAGVKSAFSGPEFKPVQVTVDGNFPGPGSANAQPGQDNAGGKHEIWVQVIEKAYAKLHGGYSGIDHGGSPVDAMEALTGEAATEKSAGGWFGIGLADLEAAFKEGKPIVMNTPDKPTLPYNLVGDHAYMLENITLDGKGGAQIQLRNPWGTTQFQPPQLIPFDKLGDGIASIDIGGKLPDQKP
jgi:hypothetical protein